MAGFSAAIVAAIAYDRMRRDREHAVRIARRNHELEVQALQEERNRKQAEALHELQPEDRGEQQLDLFDKRI